MNLLEERDEHGNIVRKCDAKCYNAKGDKCTCMCNGENHGIGNKPVQLEFPWPEDEDNLPWYNDAELYALAHGRR